MSKTFQNQLFKRIIDLGKVTEAEVDDLVRIWRVGTGDEKAITLLDFVKTVDEDLGKAGLTLTEVVQAIEDEVASIFPIDHNVDTINKQGGDGINFYHLGQGEYDKLKSIVNPTIGMQWIQGGNITGSSANLDIHFANNLFVSVDFDNGSQPIATSTDGINWTKPTVPTVAFGWTLFCIGYGAGLFVVLGEENDILTSPDGITWTSRPLGLAIRPRIVSVVFGNNIFVGVGESNGAKILTSPDGITWTERTSPISDGFRDVVFGNGLFVATGVGATNTQHIITSPDGITWTVRNSVVSNSGYESLVFGNNKFIAVGSSNQTITSPDGITWTSVLLPVSKVWTGIGFGANLYVLVSNSAGPNGSIDNILTSFDGVTWTPQTIANRVYRDVVYANNKFVLLHNFGSFYSVGTVDLFHSSLTLDDGRNPHQTRYEDLLGTAPASDRSVDGGSANSVYLPSQIIDGGSATG